MLNAVRPPYRRLTYGLTRRLTLVLSSIIVLFAVSVLSISVFIQTQMIEDRLNLSAIHLSTLIKEVSIPSILSDDPASLEPFFEELADRTDIISVSIVDPQGWLWMGSDGTLLSEVSDPLLDRAMAMGEPQQELKADYLHRTGPIVVAGEIIGFLNLRVARAPIAADLRSLWVSTALVGIACLTLGPVLALWVARRLSRPLQNLQMATSRVASGDFDHRIVNVSNDEFDLVAASINNMLDELNRSFLDTKRVAYEDKLTAIPNRSWLNTQMDNLIGTRSEAQEFAVVYLDVDRFKEVNDTHGHHVGDLLLRCFTKRVKASLEALDQELVGVRIQKRDALDFKAGEALFARLGGDEFTLLVQNEIAEDVARKIIDAMAKPFQLDGLTIPVSTSIGIARYPNDATSSEHLMKCADVAMYQAKNMLRGSFAHYDEAEHRVLLARSQFEKDIVQALDEKTFELFLQPKFNVETNMPCGAEALIRWHHPTRGNVPPDVFLPVAASMGLMPRIGELVLEEAVKAAGRINAVTSTPFRIAANVASEELGAPDFASGVCSLLNDHQLDPTLLEIEITEGTAMEQHDVLEHNIDRLRDMGVTLAIDDFGIGYSNLGRLKSMAFDTLKIDRSLIIDITESESAQSLFRTILEMASALNAVVVSEGVETEDQLAFLRASGVEIYQGYLGAKPMAFSVFEEWLTDYVDGDQSTVLETRRVS